ncbi:DUF2141 domain-containing protein [Alteromonadaceae bacterium BrNp21-10]|nr:DUF2141 domain-containing protein [Alteromonadaceae bacterium BrNp21-10]
MSDFLKSIFISVLMASSVGGVMAKEVVVNIQGIEPSKGGNIMLLLFSEKGFPKKHDLALEILTVKADATEIQLSFNTELDELALKVLHDEDENGQVTKNWTGIIPAEGLGFTNKQTIGITGPPSYKKSKVAINESQSQFNIQVRYP